MPASDAASTAQNVFAGVVPGSSNVVELRTTLEAITGVDDLIAAKTHEYPFLAPGFIDLQVNGFAGVDYNRPDTPAEQIAQSIGTMFSTGVTRCFPTIITSSEERISGAAANVSRARAELLRNGQPEGHAIVGLHIEGPYISPEDGPRGAHPLEHIRPPDIDEFERWQRAADGLIKLVTVSPEWEEAPAYIRHLVRSGIVASIGHTKATREQIARAVDAGATMSTHLGNASHSVLPKTENYIWNQLAEARLTASFIVDGIHLPGDFVHSAMRAKGIERSVLVTDAVMPAMCSPGPYDLGQMSVELRNDGSVVLRGSDRLAGSALSMNRAIGNTVRLAKITLQEAVAMATVNAARAGRIAGRLRGLSPGEKADLVLFQWDDAASVLTVQTTVVAGRVAYRAEKNRAEGTA